MVSLLADSDDKQDGVEPANVPSMKFRDDIKSSQNFTRYCDTKNSHDLSPSNVKGSMCFLVVSC